MGIEAELSRLDDILRQTLAAIELSQKQIHDISVDARQELSRITKELTTAKADALVIIEQVDAARIKDKEARQELMRVSRDLGCFQENEIKRVYENAKNIQVRLIVLTEKEKELRLKRDELEHQFRDKSRLLGRSETLSTLISVALDFLGGNAGQLSMVLGTLEKKREIAVRVIHAQEQERKRVARELHDGLAQQLAAALLGLEVSRRLLQTDSREAGEEIDNVESIIRDGLQETRQVIFNLRPLSMETLELKKAVEGLVCRLEDRTGIRISSVVHGSPRKLDKTTETCIFRIIQEALGNAVRHAMARQVDVRMEFGADFLAVQVHDDGCGFDVSAQIGPSGAGEHMGLIGMYERAELIGARLKVESQRGSGTRVSLHMPLPCDKGSN